MSEAVAANGPDHVLPRGFRWGAVRSGIKASGGLDLAAAVAPRGANAAACFTQNLVAAAPIAVGRSHLLATGGRIHAVLINAGNANCATGPAGLDGCKETCVAVAETFGCIFDEVFPSSTGIIGVPFPTEKVLRALPELRAALGDQPEHAEHFAKAILTTDTQMKLARAIIEVDGAEVRIFGAAKGAGMIHPRLGAPVGSSSVGAGAHATMLVYLFTDLAAKPEDLREILGAVVDRSFNLISIDGDTSTNDTVLLLASGASGIAVDGRVREAFTNALKLVCGSLARHIVEDGEGVSHVVTLLISGAETEAEARQVAQTIATSPLCKTAWSSGDPNWGRLLAAAGRSGVPLQPERMSITVAGHPVFRAGVRAPEFDEARTHQAMQAREYTISIDLGVGNAECRFVTCDLTAEYVRINADYST